MSTPSAPAKTTMGGVLLDTSAYTVLAGAAFFMGMSTGAFTKAGKGKRAGAKVGFAMTGLFFMAATGLLVYVTVKLMQERADEKDA